MKLRRREFLATALAGTGALLNSGCVWLDFRNKARRRAVNTNPFQMVSLGKTGIQVSLVSEGTGMNGGNRESNQVRMGKEKFEPLLSYSMDRGINYFDCADLYGTHPFVAEAFQKIPRHKYVLASKIWFRDGGVPEKERPDADVVVERFLKELKTDYIDICQIHCMEDADWPKKMEKQMEIMDRLKSKGLIRSHGVSIHSLPALKACVGEPWVDTVHVRINKFGDAMDTKDPAEVAAVVKQIHDAGKGVIGMKLVGAGAFAKDPDKRDQSIRFVMGLGAVDTMIVGFEKQEEIDDFAMRAENALKARAESMA
jgi:aryl-alcohol dehydrogenase-like predicted oxidoreductase